MENNFEHIIIRKSNHTIWVHSIETNAVRRLMNEDLVSFGNTDIYHMTISFFTWARSMALFNLYLTQIVLIKFSYCKWYLKIENYVHGYT